MTDRNSSPLSVGTQYSGYRLLSARYMPVESPVHCSGGVLIQWINRNAYWLPWYNCTAPLWTHSECSGTHTHTHTHHTHHTHALTHQCPLNLAVGVLLIGNVFPVWTLVVVLGTLAAVVVALTSKNEKPPRYHGPVRLSANTH